VHRAELQLWSVAMVGLLLACGPTDPPPQQTATPPLVIPGTRAVQTEHFATGACCAGCHSNSETASAMRDGARRPVSPHDLWRASMMANAARDPLWRAQVAVEVAARPEQGAAIEATCMRCHSPMATAQAHLLGEAPPVMALLEGAGERAEIARDGVACALCHQVRDHQLGSRPSLGGGFTIGPDRDIYGPYGDVWSHPMLLHAGYVPRPGRQVKDAGLCGTCHGWIHTSAAGGQEVALESTWLEWRNSSWRVDGADSGPKATTCQGCHMPGEDPDGQPIRTAIARQKSGKDYPSLGKRSPFGRHDFVGGNTLLPAILRDHRDDLRPEVPAAAFDAIIAAARRQLQQDSADLDIVLAKRQDAALVVQVKVHNLAGHRLPSSYTGRRMWLRLRVRDAAGQIRWSSGETDERGRIVAGDGKPHPCENVGGPVFGHRALITHGDQVQVYEAVAASADQQRARTMLGQVGWLKDNRMLPEGWRSHGPYAALTQPVGVADDPDFGPGADIIRWRIEMGAALDLAATVEVSLLYQPLGARHLAELATADLPEVRQLKRLLADASLLPEVMVTRSRSLALR